MLLAALSDEILILLTKLDMPFKSIVFWGKFIIIGVKLRSWS